MRRALVLALVAAAVAAPVRAHIGSHAVVVRNNEFEPRRLEVDPDETVTWTAQHGGHTVTADDRRFDRSLEQGESFSWTFTEPTYFTYHCTKHGGRLTGMWGAVVVGSAVSILDRAVDEGQAPHDVLITVRLDRPSSAAVAVTYSSRDGTAVAGQDYEPVAGSLTIAAGQTSATITVRVFGDTDREPTEWFEVAIDGASGAGIERTVARIELSNDDDNHRYVPTAEYPTLESSFVNIHPDTVVHVVAPIQLTRPVVISTDRVGLVGDDPSATITGAADGALVVRARDSVIRGLTLAGGLSVITLDRAERYRIEDVRVLPSSRYGIRALASSDGWIEDVSVSRSSIAGISVEACAQCDTMISRVDVRESFVGIDIVDAGSVIVRDSTLRANATAIAIRGTPAGILRRGTHVVGNHILSSSSSTPRREYAERAARGHLVRDAGVWVAGGTGAVIEDNVVADVPNAIVVAGFGAASTDVRVLHNVVERASIALGWDGVGANVCFTGNTTGGAMRPPHAQLVYSCAHPATVGVPEPLLTAELLTAGAR